MTAIIITGIIIVLCILLEIRREMRTFQMTRYTVRSRRLAGMKGTKKILFLSDLHNQTYGAENSRLVSAVLREDPDLILLGGDMFVGKRGHSYEPALQFIKQLTPICPVFYADGNHEQRVKKRPQEYGLDMDRYVQELGEAGVRFLSNESACMELGGIPVRIYGLEIPERCYGHFKRASMEAEEITRNIGRRGPDCYNILLAHNPGYAGVYKAWGADLILSGHYHGGIVRIPGIGGLVAPGFFLFPKYSGGKYEEGDSTIVVSRGLGMHTLPVRLFNPAEVVVLKLKGQQ